jgi:hypothetical protein
MAWLRKNRDPVSERARVLNDEIAALESQIQRLDERLQRNHSHPRLRSTALPHGATVSHSSSPADAPSFEPVAHEPIFENVDQDRLKTRTETTTTPDHYNELGVRKYDLPALFRRARNQFRAPSTTNPKLVSYLAAGGITGLRPMRYEKRVARNRFIALVAFLFLMLLGIIAVFLHHRQ